MQIRKAKDRGHGAHGWLDSYHTFSFADYHDPRHMGFHGLRVINEDRVSAGQGFGTHPHRDMEIISYVLSGELQHRDSLGHESVLRAGELQRITAGTGVLHSEFNPSRTEGVHFYQIWILPRQRGLAPGYEQRPLNLDEKRNHWHLVAAPEGDMGLLTIQSDARLSLARLDPGKELAYKSDPARGLWLQIVRGDVSVGDNTLLAGDGLAVEGESGIDVKALSEAEVLLFDLA